MLDQMRQKGASVFIYLIFGFLIVLFVINIAPQGNQGGDGCRGTSSVIVDVDGEKAPENAFKIAYSSPWNTYQGKGKVFHALDTLIRRELLAGEARERGIRVSREMVDEEIKKGYFFVGGERKQLEQMIFDVHEDGDRTWSLKKFRGLVQSLDVSQNAYLEEQVRGLQATLMAELMASSAQVSRDEALTDYLFERNTVTYDYVSFQPAEYRKAMLLTDGDVERFLAAHEDQVKARHKEREREFLDRKPELKLRQILIEKAEPAAKPEETKPEEAKPEDKQEDKKADPKAGDKKADAKATDPKAAGAKKPDDKKAEADPKAADAKKDVKAGAAEAPKPAGMPVAEAKAKLDAVRATIGSDKQKFIDAAKQLNTDPVFKANGGDVGWKTADNAGLGEKVVSDAVKDLKPGEMTQVITGERGVYLIFAEAKREKNLTYDQVKHELAAELAREVWSKEAAKRAAIKALADARASGKKLDELYKREPKPGMDLQELQRRMNDPSLDPQIRQILRQQFEQQIQQQLQLQMGGGDDHGSIVIESPDVLAAWKAGDGEPAAGGAAPAAPAPGAGAPAAPAPAAGAPMTGSAAPAAPAPAAGTAAPAAQPAPLVPSNDVLPTFQEVPAPKVHNEGPHPRQKRLPGLDADGVKAVFDELGKGDFASRVFEADGNFSLVQVTDKAQAKIEDFEKDAARIIDEMRKQRGEQLVQDWIKTRCEELTTAGKIKPRADKTAEYDDKGKPVPTTYRPCITLR
jgi:SurA N-terminal domain/PPIC-type PPIASE domain